MDQFNVLRQIFRGNSFANNAFILTIGTSIAQFCPLLIYPVLARAYTPEQFGVLAALTSIISILAVIFTGKYESAILIADNDKDAADIAALALILSIALGILSFYPLYLLCDSINKWSGSTLDFWILLCPLVAISINIFNCYNEWCVRKKYYINLSANKIANSLCVTLGKLFFIITRFRNWGLILGDFIGRFLTAIWCMVSVLYKDGKLFKSVTFHGVKCMAIKYIDFPKYSMPAQLLNTMGGAVPILLCGFYFNTTEVGYFSMTLTILSIPISVISYSIRDVFRQKANEIYVIDGHFDHLFLKIFKLLSLITLCIVVMFTYFLPDLFSFVLGTRWEKAGVYAQILVPMIAIDFVAMSLSGVLIITNKLKQNFIWQIYYIFISTGSLLLGGICELEMIGTLWLFSIGRSTAYVYLLVISFYYSKGNKKIKCGKS